MDKAGKPFFPSYAERSLLNSAFAKAYSDSSLYLKDKRVAQLVLRGRYVWFCEPHRGPGCDRRCSGGDPNRASNPAEPVILVTLV
jgi:hypothetical protein